MEQCQWTQKPAGDVGSLGVIGAGAMGRGIVQIALAAGVRVVLADMRMESCTEASEFVMKMLGRLVDKGKLTEQAFEQAMKNLAIGSLDDLKAFSDCDTVVEAIIERVDAKQALFARLEEVVSERCILASNTSSLSVAEIASTCQHPARVAGFHFFNPVPLMKVVEVISGQLTDSSVAAALCRLAAIVGHRAVEVIDMPGFLVNHAGRGYGTESLKLLSEGVSDVATIDRVLREQCGFRMGPFELFDLTGLDVSHTVTESIYHQFYEDPRYRPSPITAQRMKAGLYGRKSGRGFYGYGENEPAAVAPVLAPTAEAVPVWISPHCANGYAQLTKILQQGPALIESGKKPSEEALCIVTPLGEDASQTAVVQGLDATRTVAVDTLFGLDRHRVMMLTPVTRPKYRDLAHGLLAADNHSVSILQDSPGFIAQRVVASIINVASEIAQLQIASPEDIDDAVTIGLGYPSGPLAWADDIGVDVVLTLLRQLQERYGDPRYRPSIWLQRRAELGVSLLTSPTEVGKAIVSTQLSNR